MKIETEANGSELVIKLSGRLDTTTAPEFEKEIDDSISGVTKLTIDLSELEYISSAGLRVLLKTQKTISKNGEMVICGANEIVTEILEVTGFTDILTII